MSEKFFILPSIYRPRDVSLKKHFRTIKTGPYEIYSICQNEEGMYKVLKIVNGTKSFFNVIEVSKGIENKILNYLKKEKQLTYDDERYGFVSIYRVVSMLRSNDSIYKDLLIYSRNNVENSSKTIPLEYFSQVYSKRD